MCDDDGIEMDPKTFRWLAVCVAAVIIACVAGCAVAYVVHPREWMCTVNGTDSTGGWNCDGRG